MSKGFEQNLRKVSLVLQDVGSRIDAIGEDGILDEQAVKTISTQLKVLGKTVKNLVIDFGSIRLPKELSEELKSSEEAITALQEKMKNTAGQLASARMKIARNEETGEYQLSAKSKASLFRHNVIPGESKAGQVTVEGTTFTTYKSLMQAAENGSEELKKKAAEVYKYITELKAPSGESYLTTYTNEAKRLQEELDNLKKQLEAERSQSETANATKKTTTEFKQVDDILKKVNAGTDEYIAAEAKTQVETEGLNEQEKKSVSTLENKQKTLIGTAAKTVLYHNAVNMLKSMIRSAIKVVSELDKAFTDMAVVTTMSREETWKLLDSFQALAQETGKTTTEIANMATKFYQQGKSTTEVLKLTEAAAKAATIAGIDGSRSIDLLTNALNGFQLSADQAMEVSDKFASLAASAATDYEELAIALSKVASQANLAGMSMDFTLGMLTKGLEVTRRQFAA